MNKKLIIIDVISALIISILYVSSIFLSVIASYKSIVLSMVYIVVTAFLYGTSLVSRKKTEWMFKYALSIPFSFLLLQYFWKTNYSIRALNWVFPNYGKDTAGGGFTGGLLFILSSAFCLTSGILSLFIKPKNYKTFEKLQLIITIPLTMLIVVFILILEQQFPSYNSMISHL